MLIIFIRGYYRLLVYLIDLDLIYNVHVCVRLCVVFVIMVM